MRLLVVLSLAACAPVRPPPPPPPPTVVAPSPAPVAIEEKLLREAWVQPCLFTDTPKNPYCRLEALAVAPDGTVFVGGESFAAIELGGVRHKKRAYPFMVLASFDRDGKPRWSKSFGTQWENSVSDLRVIGDTLIVLGLHSNGFALDGIRLPDLPVPKVPGQDLSFRAVTAFVAALRLDGTVIWAKNLSSLFGPDAAEHFDNRRIFPDGDGGFHVVWHERGADQRALDRHVAHLRVDGTVIEHRRIPRAVFGDHGPRLLVNREGELYLEGPLNPEAKTLLRLERSGAVTEVVRIPRAPLPRGFVPHTSVHVSWDLFPNGDILALLDYQELKVVGESYKKGLQWMRLMRVNRDGRTLVDRELLQPVANAWPDQWLSWEVEQHGIRLVLRHSGRLLIEGREISPIALPSRKGWRPAASIVVLELSADGATTRSVYRPTAGACVEYFPDLISRPRFSDGALFAIAPEEGLATCDGQVRGAAVLRLDLAPR